MSRNCPDNASVVSRGIGLPGASSFNVELVPETDSEEQAEVLDSLPLGAMYFEDPEQGMSVLPWTIDNWREHYPYWKKTPHIRESEHWGLLCDGSRLHIDNGGSLSWGPDLQSI